MRRVVCWRRDGRFPGITVIADRIAKSETAANANLSVVRSEVDEEHPLMITLTINGERRDVDVAAGPMCASAKQSSMQRQRRPDRHVRQSQACKSGRAFFPRRRIT